MGEIRDQLRSDKLAIRQAGHKALMEVAQQHLRNIQARLDRGISSSGSRFVDYAPSTARRKGRFRPVTLFERGNMRGAMYVRRIRLDNVEITWRDRYNERIARFQHGGTRRRTPRDSRLKANVRRRGSRHIIRNTGAYHILPRPFIDPTAEEVVELDRLFGVKVAGEFPRDLRRRIKIKFTV